MYPYTYISNISIYIFRYVDMYIYKYAYTYVYMYSYTDTHTHTHTHKYAYTYVYMHLYTDTHTQTHTHTHTHTRISIYLIHLYYTAHSMLWVFVVQCACSWFRVRVRGSVCVFVVQCACSWFSVRVRGSVWRPSLDIYFTFQLSVTRTSSAEREENKTVDIYIYFLFEKNNFFKKKLFVTRTSSARHTIVCVFSRLVSSSPFSALYFDSTCKRIK